MRNPLAILLALFVTSALAGEGPWANITDPILRKEKLPAGAYGIEVRELESGKLLFADGQKNLLNPASSIKVLTSAALLSKLGPNHRFKTTVKRAGQDLCLVGGGDPSLVNETMWLLVEEARRRGVASVSGDLIADDSFFPASRKHLKDFRGDNARAFTAPIGALSINFNSLTIYAEPTRVGKSPTISLDPDLPIFDVRNRAKTASRASRRDLSTTIRPSTNGFSVSVGGKVSTKRDRTTIYRALPDPAFYAASVFADLFRQAGGTIAGKIRTGHCPSTAVTVFSFSSKPLSQIIFDLNKFSNNFIAEMLLRSVGAKPTAASGIDELHGWMRQNGIPRNGTLIENASGLSRKTRISAGTIVSIVRTAANDLRIGPEFLASFGISGTDGTLRRRFARSVAESRVRAKSGSLYGVVSLTGIIQTLEGKKLVFCTMFNIRSKANWKLQRLEEALILAWMNAKSR